MQEQERVAQTDPEALKRWLLASGRKYMVFNALDLVDALQWPNDHQVLQQMVEVYRDYRRTKQLQRVEQQRTLEGIVDVPAVKGETLELEEKRELLGELQKELGLELAS
jgi:hypothetical protein